MPDDIVTRVAILETKMAALESLGRDIQGLREDIHAIKETITGARWASWAVGGLLIVLAGVAGGSAALVHKLTTGPWTPP